MQRDTDFTFEDILGSPDLNDSNIINYVTRAKVSDSTSTSSNLRFILIPDLRPGFSANDATYIITDSGQYPDVTDYVAVSYCWNSFGQTSASPKPAPRISVIDQGVTRSLRCPAEVLIRAVSYAVAVEVSLIWIDQECINQEDDADVQNHLQCMHTIYKQAKMAIGLLDFELTRSQWRALINFSNVNGIDEQCLNEAESSSRTLQRLLDIKSIEFLTRLFKSVRKDRWFSRTWVFQERYSSSHSMRLLFRVSAEVKAFLQASNRTGPFVENFPLSLEDVGYIPAIWSCFLKQRSMETGELHLALAALYEATQDISTTFKGASFELMVNILVTRHIPHVRNLPADGFGVQAIFRHIESCDNQIISDRVAIFANVANFASRIDTTGLSSYSVALLVNLLINGHLPRVLIRQADEVDFGSVFVVPVNVEYLLNRAIELRYLIMNGHRGLDEDLEAIDSVLPMSARQYGSPDVCVADYREGGKTHDLLPLRDNVVGNIMKATIIPMSATVEGLFSGIISDISSRRVGLSHNYGKKIVEYGINNRQLPEGSTFVAFRGPYSWRPEFIEAYFVEPSL
jgi:hypothetical protein